MENSSGMVSRNRFFSMPSRSNSSKEGGSRPTGFNTNPKGQNRPWRIHLAWFHGIAVSRCQVALTHPKKGVSRPTGFNTNPTGQNRPWRIHLAWFHGIAFSRRPLSPTPVGVRSPCLHEFGNLFAMPVHVCVWCLDAIRRLFPIPVGVCVWCFHEIQPPFSHTGGFAWDVFV